MQTIHIIDIKNFMQLLFQTDTFDSYEFVSAELVTDMSYSINGHWNPDFYSQEEKDYFASERYHYLPWQIAKEKIFLLIKGKKTPSQLKLVLKVKEQELIDFLSSSSSSLNINHIDGIFINIHFKENQLNVICGISYKVFTLSKEIEDSFSSKLVTLFKSNSITCE